MKSINFYYMAESPPCRAVEMVASMIGIELKKHHISLFSKEHLKDDYIKINPLHKVPFIVDGDHKMGESRAIMAYLVNKFKPEDEHLYPKDPVKRARIDELLYYDIGTLFQASSQLLRPVLFGSAKELNVEDEKSYKEAVGYLDDRLAENGGLNFMVGNQPSIADISLVASLSMPIACGVDLEEFKNLIAYIERAKASITNYSQINDEPNKNVRKFFLSRMSGN